MFQPLEQFIVPLILFSTLKTRRPPKEKLVNALFLNKAVLFFIVFFLILIFVIFELFEKNYKILITCLAMLQKVMLEFLNIANFTFSIFFILYSSLFLFILFINLAGLLPFTICWTTQFFANLILSYSLILGLTLMNFDKNGMNFFSLFIPQNVPKILIGPLFISESFSYFIRILSLSIRLFSNMVAGHSLLHILFGMIQDIRNTLEYKLTYFVFIGILGFGILLIIIFSEIIVASLQAYVFAVMFVIYANDLMLAH